MKVLLTTPTFPPFNSGLGNAAHQQAMALTQAGHEVIVATGGNARTSRTESGFVVETFAVNGADFILHPIRGDIEGYVAFLKQTHWDVLVLNAWQNWATDLALRHLDEIPGRHFVYSHCISTNVIYAAQPVRSVLRYLAWRAYWWRLPRRMKRLDGVFFLAERGSDSRFDDLTIARRRGVPLRIIPNSLSSAAMALLNKPANPMPVRDRLMAVGSYQWQKGFDFVLRAYAASQARHLFPLHLYGQQHSAYSATLRAMVGRLGLREEQVVFHDGVSGAALIEDYCRARLVLSGSHTECQPLVLLDANAAGTPFIARATGCIAAMPGGLTIHSLQDMTNQLDTLVREVSKWTALADAGRQAALTIYNPERTAQLLIAALSELGHQTNQ